MKTGKLFIWIGLILTALDGYILAQGFSLRDPAFVASEPGVAAAETGNPGTNGLVAWYDFADATDSYPAGRDLTPVNTPGYTSNGETYGTAVASTQTYWTEATIDDIFAYTNQAVSFALRYRIAITSTNNSVVLSGCGARWRMYLVDTNTLSVRLHSAELASDPLALRGEWLTAVVTYGVGDCIHSLFTNGVYAGDLTGTANQSVGTMGLGYYVANDTGWIDMDIDWACFWERELTTNEVEWLYNTGSTRVYGDLSE